MSRVPSSVFWHGLKVENIDSVSPLLRGEGAKLTGNRLKFWLVFALEKVKLKNIESLRRGPVFDSTTVVRRCRPYVALFKRLSFRSREVREQVANTRQTNLKP